MARSPVPANPVLQAIWATCSHPDFEESCVPCEFRKQALVEYLDRMRAEAGR